MIDALDLPSGAPDEPQKLRKIIAALMKQVERTLDAQGGGYSSFQTAILLDDLVRERTEQLEDALEALEKSNQKLNLTQVEAETSRIRMVEAVDSVSEGFVLYDADDRLVLCNDKFWDYWGGDGNTVPYGTSFEEMATQLVHRYLVPDEEATDHEWIKKRLSRHRNPKEPFVIQLKDGRWLKINERPTKDGGIVGIYTDITDIKAQEQKQREEALAEQNILLQSTLDNLRQGVSVFDKNLKLVAWNQRFVELLDLPEEMVGYHMQYEDYLHLNVVRGEYGNKSPETYHKRLNLARSHAPLFFEYTRPNGTVLEVQRNPMPGGGFVTTYTDTTSRRKTEEDLREAKENLEERVRERTDELNQAKDLAETANLSKTRFLAAASHDLLQPLNAARLFISSLLERPLGDQNDELVKRADFALKGVESLLGALLEISKLDAGAVPVVISPFCVEDLLFRLYEEYAPLAAQKGLELRFVSSKCTINSDRKLLDRLLRNFVSNAVRYTQSGKILIGAKRHGNSLELCVCDTGPGIDEKDQEDIFEEFKQLSKTGQSRDGVGLGLAIVQRISDTLDHKVSVSSRLDKGSVFRVRVPLIDEIIPKRPTSTLSDQSGNLDEMSILIIDNEPDILLGMQSLMENWKCRVESAAGLKQALETVEEMEQFPDVIIADYHLDNGFTGVDVLGILKRDFKSDFPAMIITADRTDDIRNMVTSKGYALLNKPLKPAKLLAWLIHISKQDRDLVANGP